MSAYDDARYHDLLERFGNGDSLTVEESFLFNRLHALHCTEEAAKPPARLYGGDYVDVF